MAADFTKLEKWKKNVEIAVNYDCKNNKIYNNSYKQIFKTSLTEEDTTGLESIGSAAFDFPVVRPYLLNSLKNVKDSIPSITVTNIENKEDEEKAMQSFQQLGLTEQALDGSSIAKIISNELDEIRERSNYQNVVYRVALDVFAGGKGVFTVKTLYKNHFNFDQEFRIGRALHPDQIFFDPATHDPEKQAYVFELIKMQKEEFEKTFPDADFDNIGGAKGTVDWVDTLNTTDNKAMKIVTICYYYFRKEISKKTLYELKSGKVSSKKPKDKSNIEKTRDIKETKVYRVIFAGDELLESEHATNFYEFPYILCRGETYFEDQKEVIVPYAKHAMDAQRTMNFMGSFFLDEGINNRHQMTIINDGVSSQTEDALRKPQKSLVCRYKDYDVVDGTDQVIEHAPPAFTSSTQLNTGYLDAFSVLQKTVGSIIGAQYPSVDEMTKMSGKALYNLNDYMSSSNEVFMQNLEEAVRQVHLVILKSLPDIGIGKQIKVIAKVLNANKQYEKQSNVIDYNFLFDAEKFNIAISPGVNYKLQQEATIERLVELSQESPLWAQFLSTPQGTKLLLDNMNLNNKQDWIDKFDEWVTSQQQGQEGQEGQQGAAQNAEAQMQQQDIQNKSMLSQAKLMDAQTNAKSLQLKQQTAQVDNVNKNKSLNLKAIEISHQIHNDSNTKAIDLQRIAIKDRQDRRQHIGDLAKLQADIATKSASI